MQISWRLKSLAFRLIDIFNAQKILYFIQKNITRRSFRPSTNVHSRVNNYHLDNSLMHKNFLISNNLTGPLFEFGAGKNLFQNIFMSEVVNNQVIVDLNKMIDIDLVNLAINDLKKSGNILNNKNIETLKDLEDEYNIFYLAPYDASKTNYETNYFDSCISTNTLEHIPKESIILIFKELKRIIRKNGMISAIIDYSDHYAHTDNNIGLLNFLNYSEDQWKKYNHSSHYQNRLRHYDYISIFKSLGYKVESEIIKYEENNISDILIDKYKEFPKTWSATSAHIILRCQ